MFLYKSNKPARNTSCPLHYRERKDELDGEIFEMLNTFSDFVTFKEMFLDYRAVSWLNNMLIMCSI